MLEGEDILAIPNVAGDLSLQDIEDLEKWAVERERAEARDPLNFGFPPHEGQVKVHAATEDEVFLVAANRWGKSVTGIREVLWRATGTHPYKKTRPHKVIWCGFVDFGFYNKVTKRLFDEWVPKDYLIQFHESEKWARFKRADGGTCTVYFLSYESGRMSWQGGAVDFVWLDEECPQDIYHEAYARTIDTRGQLLLTQTPVTGLGWAYDEIYLPAKTGERKTLIVQGALATRDPEREYEVGEPLVPHLSREQILRMAAVYKDVDERAIRVFGEFRGRSGGVFKMFDPEIHVIPSFKVPQFYEIWGAVDPGYHGFAALLFAQDPKGRVYVAGEYYSQEEGHQTRFRELWKLARDVFALGEDDYIVFYCDTANPQDILELNLWAQEAKSRMVFASLDHGLKAREAGIQRVQEFLYPNKKRETPKEVDRARPPQGEPMLYFFDTLHSRWEMDEAVLETSRVLWEMQRYLWEQTRRNQAHPMKGDDKSADGAHALSALRYGMMARLSAPDSPPPDDPRRNWDPEIRRHMEEREAELATEEGWTIVDVLNDMKP